MAGGRQKTSGEREGKEGGRMVLPPLREVFVGWGREGAPLEGGWGLCTVGIDDDIETK